MAHHVEAHQSIIVTLIVIPRFNYFEEMRPTAAGLVYNIKTYNSTFYKSTFAYGFLTAYKTEEPISKG